MPTWAWFVVAFVVSTPWMVARERARRLLRRRNERLLPVIELPRPAPVSGERQLGEHAEWWLDFAKMEATFDSRFDLFHSKTLAKIARASDGRWYYRDVMVRFNHEMKQGIQSAEEHASDLVRDDGPRSGFGRSEPELRVARARHWQPFPDPINAQVNEAYTRLVGFFAEHPGLTPRDGLREVLTFASLSFDPLELRGQTKVWAPTHRYDAEEVTADAAELRAIEERHERIAREEDEAALLAHQVENID